MTRSVERLLNLQPGDLNRGAPLFAYLFLVIASSVVGKAARSALFLGEYAAVNLPYVTVVIAILVGLVVAVYLRIEGRVRKTGRSWQNDAVHFWTFNERGQIASYRHFNDTAAELAAWRD